jgi:imidazolonepropionase-like amidohydrolase
LKKLIFTGKLSNQILIKSYLSIMKLQIIIIFLLTCLVSNAQSDSFYLLKPARIFDGETMHNNWVVLVKGNTIEEVGDMTFKVPANTRIIEMKDATLLPGLIEGHSHLFLHPYNEVSWNDQVLKESRAERTARAVMHAEATLMAGFTTMRDLGTEGAMYDDAGLKTAIQKQVFPGPRLIVATRAIVAKGAYGPNFGNADIDLPQGAAEVSGLEDMANEVYTQIKKGADVVKLYADYRWGKDGKTMPTFSIEQITVATNIAKSSGRISAAHATTKEGMRRAIMGGVTTIEHGNYGDDEIFKLMKEKGVALCPTIAAYEAIAQYGGWKKGIDPEPLSITEKRKSFQSALKNGVTICMGGDVGVFPHGDNVREMEFMVDYGMKPTDVLRSATSVNADVFGYGSQLGRIKKGFLADIIMANGDPSENINALRKIIFVMKDGKIYKEIP